MGHGHRPCRCGRSDPFDHNSAREIHLFSLMLAARLSRSRQTVVAVCSEKVRAQKIEQRCNHSSDHNAASRRQRPVADGPVPLPPGPDPAASVPGTRRVGSGWDEVVFAVSGVGTGAAGPPAPLPPPAAVFPPLVLPPGLVPVADAASPPEAPAPAPPEFWAKAWLLTKESAAISVAARSIPFSSFKQTSRVAQHRCELFGSQLSEAVVKEIQAAGR